MDYKKTNAPTNTVTSAIMDLCQISVVMKAELSKKLQEFASANDSLDEMFENREQIEISRYYEKLPKASLIATEDFIEGRVYYRNPLKEGSPE